MVRDRIINLQMEGSSGSPGPNTGEFESSNSVASERRWTRPVT
jgi:hypothetical protein